MDKANGNRLMSALSNSINGLKFAYKDEEAFRQDILLVAFMLPLIYLLSSSKTETLLMIYSLLFLLLSELLNSAVENTVDRIGEERHILSQKAKDTASAAVLLALVNIAITFTVIGAKNYKNVLELGQKIMGM